MIESIFGTIVTVERGIGDVYMDMQGMEDILLTPEMALRLSDKLRKVALQVAEEMEDR